MNEKYDETDKYHKYDDTTEMLVYSFT